MNARVLTNLGVKMYVNWQEACNQCSEAASPARFTVDLDRTIKWAASRLLTQAGHRYGGQRSDRTADIWRPMVRNHDINKQGESRQISASLCRLYAEWCRPVKSHQISAGICRYMQRNVGQSKAVRYLQVFWRVCCAESVSIDLNSLTVSLSLIDMYIRTKVHATPPRSTLNQPTWWPHSNPSPHSSRAVSRP